MQEVVTLGVLAIACQLVKAWATPDVGGNAPIVGEQIACGDGLTKNGA